VRDSVVFIMMVLFSVGLSGSVILQPLLWWHCERFSTETWWVPMLGGPKNGRGSPNTRVGTSAQVLRRED
jgi:hypothetical protein